MFQFLLQNLVSETPYYFSLYHGNLNCNFITEFKKLKGRDIWIHKHPSNMLSLALISVINLPPPLFPKHYIRYNIYMKLALTP
jgi:hypothetical protein